jgi:hypothetical protein
MENVRSLKPKQINAIQLLAVGTPAYQVAERLDVSAMTIHRWQQIPEFEAKLHSITNSGLEEIAKKMNIAALTAVETLQEAMCDMSEPITTRMKAATGVLNAMPSVNGALEKCLVHRAADFDLKTRFRGQAYTYDSNGNPCQTNRANLPKTNGGVISDNEIEV